MADDYFEKPVPVPPPRRKVELEPNDSSAMVEASTMRSGDADDLSSAFTSIPPPIRNRIPIADIRDSSQPIAQFVAKVRPVFVASVSALFAFLHSLWTMFWQAVNAAYSQTVRLLKYAWLLWKWHASNRDLVAAQLTLGKRMYQLGIGDRGLLDRIREMTQRIQGPTAEKNSYGAAQDERRQLTMSLAATAIQDACPSSSIEPECRNAIAIRNLHEDWQSKQDHLKGMLFPAETGDRCRVIGGICLGATIVWLFCIVIRPGNATNSQPSIANGMSNTPSPKNLFDSSVPHSTLTNANLPPLLLSSRNGRADQVQHFLENGDSVSKTGPGGETALHWAASYGHQEVVAILLSQGADIDATMPGDMTALHLAAQEGQDEVVRCLIQRGADPEVENIDGALPLHLAAAGGHGSTIFLLLTPDSDINSQDSAGTTPLHLAAAYGHLDAVSLLLTKGANALIEDDAGKIPIDLAEANHHSDVAHFLSQYSILK